MRDKFVRYIPSYFAGAATAAVAAWAIPAADMWLIPLLVISAYLLYLAYRVYLGGWNPHREQQLSELHLATIEALALAIGAKDRRAPNHLRRIQVYATRLARALKMREDEIQGVKTAALLHDIGKLAVPDHILAKPGGLTPEEFQKVRIHPQVGAEIIQAVPFPYPVAPLILSHHERWDGQGYPAGLKGDEIPLGARILCLMDHFAALTSDRPYNTAMTIDAAVGVLRQEAGRTFDPNVVDTFIRILPELCATTEQHDQFSAFENIALAHREIYGLYQVAQTMGTSLGIADMMALVSSKLSHLVPFSTCALFLYSESAETLACRFATGADAELVRELVVPGGQGMIGWVARTRRSVVNARPATDFEAARVDAQTMLQSALVCPLIVEERFIGAIAVYHKDAGFYRDDHRRLLESICEQAAAVIHNSIVFEQTQEDSLTDPLTGLPNTRFMFMHLTRELARAHRLTFEVSLLVFDLDDFKDINDNYGHHNGDRALREVADVLRAGIRPYDICVRYAGDEFIVVLSGCGRDEANNKRIELQQAVDRIFIEARPGELVPVAISAGAAVFPHDGDSYESLLAKADSRMYQDKSLRKAARRQSADPSVALTDPKTI